MATLIDLTGRKFGCATVTQESSRRKGKRQWLCICDCGQEFIGDHSKLVTGKKTSCGCKTSEKRSKISLMNLVGKKFGRLTVTARSDRAGGVVFWDCICDCGAHTSVRSEVLRKGRSRSCGCLKRESSATNARKLSTKHGMSHLKEYAVWRQMLARCENPKNSRYYTYGALGISVCERWHTFTNFLEDMGMRPDGKYSIDRINVYGNYEKGNCRWATDQEQAQNKRVKTE